MTDTDHAAGTLDLVQIQDALYDWVYSVTRGILEEHQIVWRDQSEQIPARPFVSLKLISGPSPTDRDGSIFLNGKAQPINVGMQMEAALSVQVFGNTQIHRSVAHQLAMDLNTSLLRPSIRDALKAKGIAIQGLGKPQNLSALEESKFEERAGFDVELGLVQNILDQPGNIERINITQTVDGDTTDKTVVLP